jgi:hypothetical protein
MYPSFNADSRIEMFCRGQFDSWTCVGYEAGSDIIDDSGDAHSVAALYELARLPAWVIDFLLGRATEDG